MSKNGYLFQPEYFHVSTNTPNMDQQRHMIKKYQTQIDKYQSKIQQMQQLQHHNSFHFDTSTTTMSEVSQYY